MARLILNPNPTFKAKVEIPIPGGDTGEVEFVFKHRDRDELKAFAESMKDMEDAQVILNIASGWDLADEFTPDNVARLVLKFFAAPKAVFEAYLSELTQAKEKN